MSHKQLLRRNVVTVEIVSGGFRLQFDTSTDYMHSLTDIPAPLQKKKKNIKIHNLPRNTTVFVA